MWIAFISVMSIAANPPGEIRIPGASLAEGLDRTLQGLEVHLDYDVPGKKGQPVMRSFVKLPARMGGERTLFSMPNQTIDLGSLGQVQYGIHDVNLSKLKVTVEGDHFLLSLWFEDKGYELVAVRNGGLSQLVPDLQMDEMKLTLALTPKQGAAEIERGKVTFDAQIKPGSDSLGLGPEAFAPFSDRIKQEVEQEANRQLSSKDVLDALNARIAENLASLAGGVSVGKAHFDGTDLLVSLGAGSAKKKTHSR